MVHILWWELCRTLVWLPMTLLYRHRAVRPLRVPAEGPLLLICNHQSFIDLVAIGVGLPHRHFWSMARRTLFELPLLRRLIVSLNAFRVEQDKSDIAAMRRAVELLKEGRLVLVFPEGARTWDGQIVPFSRGMMLLIKRAKPTVVPAAVAGPFDIWPRFRRWPRATGRTCCVYGEPISSDVLLERKPDDALDHLRQRVESLHAEACEVVGDEGRA